MRVQQRIGSWSAIGGALAIIGSAIATSPQTWPTRLCEPDVFLTAFALAGTAILLWPRGNHLPTPTIIGREQL